MKKRKANLSKLIRKPKSRQHITEFNILSPQISPVVVEYVNEYIKSHYVNQSENPYFVADQAIDRLREVLDKNISINQKSKQILTQAQKLNQLLG